MTGATRAIKDKVRITVELFGMARIACGRQRVSIETAADGSIRAVVAALADACPELVGKAVSEDSSALMESYTFNLNGTSFIDEGAFALKAGDTLLLFSSQAGG